MIVWFRPFVCGQQQQQKNTVASAKYEKGKTKQQKKESVKFYQSQKEKMLNDLLEEVTFTNLHFHLLLAIPSTEHQYKESIIGDHFSHHHHWKVE